VDQVSNKILDTVKSSVPYKASIEKAIKNKDVQKELGTPIKSDLTILSLNDVNHEEREDYGKTDMHIPLVGSNGTADLHVIGKKMGNGNVVK